MPSNRNEHKLTNRVRDKQIGASIEPSAIKNMSAENNSESGSVDQPDSKERRRHLRFPYIASVTLQEKAGAQVRGRITDLGLGGCYVDAISPFPVGTILGIQIQKQKESFEAQAKVIYSQAGMGMGLVFISAEPDHIRLFQKWILDLSGNEPPLPDPPESKNEQGSAETGVEDEQSYVLSELVIALMRKGILAEAQGKAMLQKLHG